MKMRSEPSPIPNTRKELLGVILKEHFFDIVICSIYTFVFAFPLVFWLIFISQTSYIDITEDNYLLNSLVVYIPIMVGILIFGIGLGGSLYYMKKLVFQEGSNVHQDFFKGIKETIKQSLLSYGFIAVLYGLMGISKTILSFSEGLNDALITILVGIMYVVLFISLIIVSFNMTQSILYNATQGQLITNSVRFFIGKLLFNILFFGIIFTPLILYEVFAISYIHWILFGICAIWHFGFSSLLFTLYSHYIFDLTINKNYPEIYRKGLKKE